MTHGQTWGVVAVALVLIVVGICGAMSNSRGKKPRKRRV